MPQRDNLPNDDERGPIITVPELIIVLCLIVTLALASWFWPSMLPPADVPR